MIESVVPMNVDGAGPVAQSYTILRIKRKRNEEPLDALVVESRRRKKSRGGIGVFQFAQTVEHDAWEDEKRQRDIQDQISRLARESASNAETKALNSLSNRTSPSISKDDSGRRYKIIPQETEEESPTRRRLPTSPPKVISSKDLPPKQKPTGFKLYDAVLSADQPPAAEADDEMEKFMPMLNEYLKLHDLSAPTSVPSVTQAALASSTSSTNDYVWDVFYHRPATLSEWNEAANVGTLTGLPPSITDPYDSTSDSEEEDDADEDSNAEEYYKNDYPDEETSDEDSDAFHEDSENESTRYEEDGSDHEWR
ncbi:hypothetical protein B0H10DRAFT_2020339 [Mycena sp. CBHHK59/15]|nr:hypothetical protein B0H10DRAFT_2020339 [Mycena sp. CBHHK59/15]